MRFISVCKFGSFKNPFATITLSELYFKFRKFVLFLQTKKSDSYELAAKQAAESDGDESEVWPDTYDEG